jgi:hypothetical protein
MLNTRLWDVLCWFNVRSELRYVLAESLMCEASRKFVMGGVGWDGNKVRVEDWSNLEMF